MVNKEILKTIESYLKDKVLTYEDYISILKDERIDDFFAKVLNGRTTVSQEEIENLSNIDSVNELYSIYLELNNIVITEELEDDSLTDDIVKQYINEIGRYPLLSYEEEQQLCRVFNKHLKEIREDENLDKSNGLRQYLTKEEQAAFDKFINSNYRLVISIAKRYKGRGLDFADLIQDGNMGLIKSAEKFDVDTGYRFSTYATWWIKQCITRSIADNSKTIRIPVHLGEFLNKVKSIVRDYYAENASIPTNRQIAIKYLELDPNNISKEDEDKIFEIVYKIEDNAIVSQDLLSLDLYVGEEEDSTLGDFVADDKDSIEKTIMKKLLKETMYKVLGEAKAKASLKELSKREADVLALRYGLYDGKRRTLDEVGKIYGVTRERIRQIEAKSLRKLRSNEDLKSYAEEFVPYLRRRDFVMHTSR